MADYFGDDERRQLIDGGRLVLNDTQTETSSQSAADHFAALQIHAIVNSAYVSDHRLEFMLTATKHQPYNWHSDEIQLLQELAANVYLRIQRARTEDALRQSEDRLTTAMKAGGLAAWEWNPQQSVWTDELYEMLGISREQTASPELLFSLTHPGDVDRLQAAWQKAVNGQGDYSQEFRIIRPDGRVRWLKGVGTLVRDNAGKIVRMFGLNWDSTDQHIAAARVEEARRLAEQANAAKSEFVANMSHEIRTPMTAVLGYTDLLLDSEQDPQKLEYLQTIKRNGSFLLDIINDILDLSKIEAGRMDIHRQRFSPQSLVSDVRSLMELRAREKNLKFEVEYAGQIPAQIESDPKRLKQILVNLIGNAIKFTEAGSVTLRVEYLAKRLPQLKFDVIDTGIGMTAAQQRRLFQPFSQGDASVNREFGGTGLGLVISQRLSAMLDGSVTFESQPGSGSTFTCAISVGRIPELTLVDPKRPAEQPTGYGAAQHQTAPSEVQLNCRILVVDDRRDIRFLARHLLQAVGATVDEAEDGQQAIDRVAAMQADEPAFDLILLDMQMPGVDGYTAAAKLRSLGFTNPIIALTADAMHGDMKRCLNSGCNAYLSKPIDKETLLTTVQHYLSQS
jgi:two-component system CheB/CheR fusion protein